MTAVVFLALAAVVVFVTAAVVIGREARRLAQRPAQAVVNLDEAIDWIADRLPAEISATWSYDEVGAVFAMHLELLRERGLARYADGVVTDDDEVDLYAVEPRQLGDVAAVVTRAAASDVELDPAQVEVVLDLGIAYLTAIGMVGEVAEPAPTDVDGRGAAREDPRPEM